VGVKQIERKWFLIHIVNYGTWYGAQLVGIYSANTAATEQAKANRR